MKQSMKHKIFATNLCPEVVLEQVLYEQPSLPLEEMEKAWGDNPIITFRVKRLNTKTFYCKVPPPTMPLKHVELPIVKLTLPSFAALEPVKKKRKVLSSR